MTNVFRQEVSKIRARPDAVVVYCVDAINVNGSLLKGIRKYVGGNPILLAITRCDLLPEYVWDTKDTDVLKDVFRKRAKDIFPAEVYLCSESKTHMDKIGGIKALAQDLWDHLDGRDPYTAGAANLGKSTLTDTLICGFINKGEKLDHFTSNIATRRVEKLRDARVTKSALPGTTLQNMRVPCFADHEQALWDTPGLLLHTSLSFPLLA